MVNPYLIAGAAAVGLYLLFAGSDKVADEEQEDDTVSSRDLTWTAGPPNGVCEGYTEMTLTDAQAALNKLGHRGADGKSFAADGKYGPNTRAALLSIQKLKGLTQDGYLGKQTGDAITASLKSDITGPPPKAEQKYYLYEFGRKDGFESKGLGYNYDNTCNNVSAGKGCSAVERGMYNAGFKTGARQAGDRDGQAFKKTGAPFDPSAFQSSNEDYQKGFRAGYIAAAISGVWASVGAEVDARRHAIVAARAERAA